MLSKALGRGFRDMFSGSFMAYAVMSFVISIVVLILLTFSINRIFALTDFVETGWLDTALDWIASIGGAIVAWFLFPICIPLIAALFQERLAEKIEKKYYSDTCYQSKWTPAMLAGVKFVCLALLLNIIALPFYLIPLLGTVLYYWLNAYLISRECFNLVGYRILPPKESDQLRKTINAPLIGFGVLLVIGTHIPLLNFVMPLIAVLVATHYFHLIRLSRA